MGKATDSRESSVERRKAMTKLSEVLDSLDRPQRWSKPHTVKRKDLSEYRVASQQEIRSEGDRLSAHRIGSGHASWKDKRKAGHLYLPHEEQEFAVEHLEQSEHGLDEKIKNSCDESGNDHVWTIREIHDTMPDYRLTHPEHHGFARHVLLTTESDIKQQRIVADLLKKQAEEKRQKEQQKAKEEGKAVTKDGEKQQDPSKEQSGDDAKEKSDKTESKDGDEKSPASKGSEDLEDSEDSKEDDRELSNGERHFLEHITREIVEIMEQPNNAGHDHFSVQRNQVEPTIDEQDQFLPDSWINRSPHLIRLTGQQPLNAEPDLTELFGAGLITPNKLHYVRNHGEVPKLNWESHTVEIFSDPPNLLKKPKLFTMDELAAFPKWIRIPVTLACDGNRRKEVNMVKRSTGFNWGSGATSCVFWKGPLLRDLLLSCEVGDEIPPPERLWVHWEGADSPSEGSYATSLPASYVLDPNNDVMLAIEMNDQPLHPDHGYPVRSIIPGFVGGRCVKWLKRVWLSDKPSTNHYHIWDNRVLPSYIDDADSLEARVFYHHPDTICNELPLQSVICRPSHNEAFDLQKPGIWTDTYRVAGYAYSGGGVRIQRVELSLDAGKTWRITFRSHVDDYLRHGTKTWAWCHWYLDVNVTDLLKPGVTLTCRAFDQFKNTQPNEINWNLSGMMNNCRFVIKPRFELQGDKHDRPTILWDHPVVPGASEGGWQKPSPEEVAKLQAEEAKSDVGREVTIDELSKHNSKDDCWLLINEKVYDVTSVITWHPGGANAILAHAGKAHVATSLQYNSVHDGYANKKRDECLIGKLTAKGAAAIQEDAKKAEVEMAQEAKARADFAVQKHKWTAIKLKERTELSDDTRLYKFQLPGGKNSKLGLPIGNHVAIGLHFADSMCVRQYTPTHPILPEEEDGEVHLVVKTYFGNEKFPPGGTMGNFLDVLTPGEEVDIRGPLGEITYNGNGNFTIEGKDRQFDRISLLAGGSGITPIYQLVHAILKRSDDETEIRVVDCDANKADILLYNELRDLEKKSNGQFRMWVILSHYDEKKDGAWDQGTGHLDDDAIEGHLFPAGDKTAAFVCGPPGLITHAAAPGLKKAGYKDDESLFGF